MAFSRSALASALALTLTSGAFAQDALPPPQEIISLDEGLALATRLDRLSVIGSADKAQEASGSAHYLDSEALEKFDYRDINRVLRQVPGVYLVEEEGYGLRPNIGIRGSGTDRNSRITVMEDGVLIAPAPYAAPAAYYFPTMARISAMEIRKGSASIKHGPRTTGGAINLISTPIPAETSGQVEATVGSDNTFLNHAWVGTSDEHYGLLLEGVHQQTDGFKQLDGGGDSGYRLDDLLAKFRLTTGANASRYQELELKLGRQTHRGDETYLGLTEADFQANPLRRYAGSQQDRINTAQELAELRHRIELSDAVDFTTSVYRTQFARNWYKLNDVQGTSLSSILANPQTQAERLSWLQGSTSPDNALRVRANNRSYYAQGLQSVLGWRFGGNVSHELELGLRWHKDEEDRFQWDDRYRMQDGEMVLTSAGIPGTQTNRVGQAETLSLYLQDEIRVGQWIITPGLRYEDIDLTRLNYALTPTGRAEGPTSVDQSSVDALLPGVGTTLLMSDSLSLLGSVHRGFNPPGPGSNAEAEESTNAEFGVRYAADALSAELIGFWNDYSNLVGTCTASTGGNCEIGDQFNGGKTRIRGIEASASHVSEVGNGLRLPLQLSYTYTEAEFRSSFDSGFDEWGDVEAGFELPYLPEHLLHASAGLAGERWSFTLAGNYLDSMRTVAGHGVPAGGDRTDQAWVFDLIGNYALNDKFELFARIENLLDEEYVVARRPAGARPGQPRSAFVGVRFGF